MDMKEKKMTVIGTVDPVNVVSKLRKHWPTTDIISVGPAKEPEKKEEPKKEEAPKKEEGGPNKEEPKKAYRAYNPQMTSYYYVQSMEENPNACVIC
ncbi:Heavy metal-associated isoprenylated plant protein 39 [Linum grandiflorum]